MRKTRVTWFLDFIRLSTKVVGIITILYLFRAAAYWPLTLTLAIPICLAVPILVDYASIPIYLLTPENRAQWTILGAIEEGDFSTALKVLKAHEKWHAAEARDGPNVATIEASTVDHSLARAVSAT